MSEYVSSEKHSTEQKRGRLGRRRNSCFVIMYSHTNSEEDII